MTVGHASKFLARPTLFIATYLCAFYGVTVLLCTTEVSVYVARGTGAIAPEEPVIHQLSRR